jgi:hypothetical protein
MDEEMSQKHKYRWQDLLQDATLEFKPKELRRKVQRAEAAIFARAEALSLFGRGNQEEQQAIEEALSTLEELRKNRSAFPD